MSVIKVIKKTMVVESKNRSLVSLKKKKKKED